MKEDKITLLVLLLFLIASLGSCVKKGCKDSNALNFDSKAKKENGTCIFKAGCMDPKSTNFCKDCKVDDGSCKYLKIGDSYGGGIIFYIDSTGLHGLIASTSDQALATWGTIFITKANGTAIGTGQANTALIIGTQGSVSPAANICNQLVLNGFNDWFLPSVDELRLMLMQKSEGIITGFSSGYYWSSTESDSFSAWTLQINTFTTFIGLNATIKYGNPFMLQLFKGDQASVRAIRAF